MPVFTTSAYRQSPNDVSFFLRILFVLHICTAFLTIIHALQGDLSDQEGEQDVPSGLPCKK